MVELRYKFVVARDAREALEHMNRLERIDIHFSDVVMPGGMNGAQLALRAESSCSMPDSFRRRFTGENEREGAKIAAH